jgi:ribosome biogenesis protein MAK21
VDVLIHERFGGRDEEPLNSEAFWQKKREEIKPDEVFFHKYFETAGKRKSRAEKRREGKKGEEDEDVDDVEGDEGTDDEEEKEIWKALVGSRPEIEGDDAFDEDEELDLGEFMDDDDEDDLDVDGEDEEEEGEEGVTFAGFDSDADSIPEDEDILPETDDLSDEGGVGIGELESEDEDAFVGSDDELPAHLPVPEDEEEEELDEKAVRKKERDEKKKKKRTMKSLPTFASAEDYARLIGGDSEEEGM